MPNNKIKTSAGLETPSETVARVQAARYGNAPAQSAPKSSTDAVMEELSNRLMGSAGGMSSNDSNIDTTIAEAIRGVEDSNKASNSRLKNDYNYNRDSLQGDIADSVTNFTESRSGFATQMATLRQLTETSDKALRDLDVRYQDALAANDANTAQQIAALKLEKIKYVQEKEKQFYDNAFSLAGLDLQKSSQAQAAEQFKATLEDQKAERELRRQDDLYKLGAQFGVAVEPGESFSSVTAKIATIANEERRQEALERVSRMSKDAAEEDQSAVYDDIITEAVSKGKNATEAALAVLQTLRKSEVALTSKEYAEVKMRAEEIYSEYKKTSARTEAEAGGGFLSKIFGGGRVANANQWTGVPSVAPSGFASPTAFGGPTPDYSSVLRKEPEAPPVVWGLK